MHSRTLDVRSVAVSLSILFSLSGCSGTTSDGRSQAGGTSALGGGGAKVSGGEAAAQSGGTANGGTLGSGGASAPSTGGASAGGATDATRGGATSLGGSSATGGAAGSSPIASGGKLSSGGSAAMGGSSAKGGATGSGGEATSGPPSSDPVPSPGCTGTPTTSACNTQNSPCTLSVGGTERKYWVQLPDSYDPKRPYPVVFEYHPLGGNGWQGLTMYQIRPKFPNAIYVSPDGLTSGQYQGFSNTNGEDEAMTRAIMAELEGKYCVDKGRYFATGFSFGGSMSFTAACNMSDVFRAIGAMSGAPISGATCTSKKPVRQVAVWATHGDMDTALPIKMAQPIIDALVKYNGCSSETKPVEPAPCVEYQNCATGYPVVWCVRPGDPHAIPSFGAAAISKFFQQF